MTTPENDPQVQARLQVLLSKGFNKYRAALQVQFEFLVAEFRRAGLSKEQAIRKAREQTGQVTYELLNDSPGDLAQGKPDGAGGSTKQILKSGDDEDVETRAARASSPPLTPPSSQMPSEVIRRRLRELGIQNVNQVLRTYDIDLIREALEDYETSLGDRFRPKSPTGYFWSLLK